MARPKGSKNKSKQPIPQKVTHYYGHFLIDSGVKLEFDVRDDEVNDEFDKMMNNVEFPNGVKLLYLGESSPTSFLRTQKIVGYNINTYESEE